MNNFIYILSDRLDYSKLICNDAGPGYAQSMSWSTLSIKSLTKLDSKSIYIIDNRISEKETFELSEIITENPTIDFIIKLVDPFFENYNHFYYLWVCKILVLENVRLLSVYESKEITFLISHITSKPIIFAPYPYDPTKEVSLKNLGKRSNKVIISGSINKSIYPFRSAIWQKSRRSLSRFLFDILKHPGYAEIHKQDFTHNFTKSNFIKYLSNYKYMLLCGSRCDIEFLKFHECAYAGCLPIGKYPTIFPKEIKNLFYTPNVKNLFSSTVKYLLKWNKLDHENKILLLRNYLSVNRSASEINKNILSHYKT